MSTREGILDRTFEAIQQVIGSIAPDATDTYIPEGLTPAETAQVSGALKDMDVFFQHADHGPCPTLLGLAEKYGTLNGRAARAGRLATPKEGQRWCGHRDRNG